MNKLTATNQEMKNENQKTKNKVKEKITLEGWLFYLLLFMAIIGLPAASTIWILSAVNSNYVP